MNSRYPELVDSSGAIERTNEAPPTRSVTIDIRSAVVGIQPKSILRFHTPLRTL